LGLQKEGMRYDEINSIEIGNGPMAHFEKSYDHHVLAKKKIQFRDTHWTARRHLLQRHPNDLCRHRPVTKKWETDGFRCPFFRQVMASPTMALPTRRALYQALFGDAIATLWPLGPTTSTTVGSKNTIQWDPPSHQQGLDSYRLFPSSKQLVFHSAFSISKIE